MNQSNSGNPKPIDNPYIVGNPVKDSEMFFGREEEFAFIRQKIAGAKKGGLVVLCGARRSGKTSILFQIMNGRLGDDYFPVLIDMQSMSVKNDREFLVKLAQRISDAPGAPRVSLSPDFVGGRVENPLDGFQEFVLDVVDCLAGKKLVLLFDEYEIFESQIDKGLLTTGVLDLFSSWLDHQEDIFLVFTGSEKIDERKPDYWSRFLPKAVFYKRISFLAKRDALRLIEEPLRDVIAYDGGIPDEICELTAGHPYYTQVFCQIIVDNLNDSGERKVTSRSLETAVDQIVENPLPQMIFSWSSLTDVGRLTLSIMGELAPGERAPVHADDIRRFARVRGIGLDIDHVILNETLEKLFHEQILSKTVSDAAYAFKMELWRRWIVRMHSVWEVTDEIKDGGGLGEGISPARFSRFRWGIVTSLVVVVGAVMVMVWYLNREKGGIDTGDVRQAVDSTEVSVVTSPPGAEVIVGETILGVSPIENHVVAEERAAIRVRLAGFKEYRDTLDFNDPGQTDVAVDLVERTGGLRLTSSPEGAAIFLDGEATGQMTPAVIDNLSVMDFYNVRLTMDGHEPVTITGVQVIEDSTITRHHDFNRLKRQVRIVSTPDSAEIYLDGRLAGLTPDLYSLSYGVHRVEVTKEGYEPLSRELRVPEDGGRVEMALRRLPPGELVIMVRPWADIYVDGELVAGERTNYRLPLFQGSYTVRLVNPHFPERQKTIEITPESEEVWECDLREEESK